MAKLDGTNGLLQQYDYQVLTTAFSYTFAAGTQTLIINPAGTLATGTITMPPAPADGMSITIESTQIITAITVQGNTGQSIVGAPTQLLPNQPVSFVYRVTNTTWYPLAGAGAVAPLVLGTVVATTSGTTVDFTSLPTWVKRITVMLNGVSTTGTSPYIVRLGVSGSPETTGYTSICVGYQSNTVSSGQSTAGFVFTTSANMGAASSLNGPITFSLLGSNTWVCSGALSREAGSDTSFFTMGSKTLAGTLNMVRITTTGGTETFDAGSINILYE